MAEPWFLERWCLKTAINLGALHSTATRWRQTGEPLDRPPLHLVRMAFGQEPIVKPLGLHWLASVGEGLALVDRVSYAPLLYGEPPALISGLFTFRGLRFLMHFEPHALPSPLHLPNGKGVWRSGQLGYHLERLNWAEGKKISHYVQLLWHLAPKE